MDSVERRGVIAEAQAYAQQCLEIDNGRSRVRRVISGDVAAVESAVDW